ncbi:hypothetical protein PGTUg99_001809 [Puccinia graminis f. sp. tritici]|uniref:Uncharacterized protein n=1 Tax=Puccinia graminis f. sp. tritici TaxID=56615 RepID=A0A5B0P657_PUCGR|nr:hypothetical protein PGTUg99_001809 [Puccinia graminis f. sp. tritici]
MRCSIYLAFIVAAVALAAPLDSVGKGRGYRAARSLPKDLGSEVHKRELMGLGGKLLDLAAPTSGIGKHSSGDERLGVTGLGDGMTSTPALRKNMVQNPRILVRVTEKQTALYTVAIPETTAAAWFKKPSSTFIDFQDLCPSYFVAFFKRIPSSEWTEIAPSELKTVYRTAPAPSVIA